MATSCGPESCGPGCGWGWCCSGWRKACSPTARWPKGRRCMSTIELRPAFRRRIRTVTRQIWSLHVGHGIARTVVVAAALLAAVAAADYFFELPWLARAALAAVCVAAVAVL